MTLAGAPGAWAGIVGQSAAVALLQRAIALDRLAHAYAFVGPSGVGRRLTALAFAQAALCAVQGCGTCAVCRRVAAGQHPDCHLITPTPPRDNPKGAPMIRIEEVRELEHTAALAPHAGGRKVFVLDDAERMTLPTAQALLKTVEEPPPRTHLVLIIANPRALPPTLLSRCQRVRFGPLSETDAARLLESRGVAPAASELLRRGARGSRSGRISTRSGPAGRRRWRWRRSPRRGSASRSTGRRPIAQRWRRTSSSTGPGTGTPSVSRRAAPRRSSSTRIRRPPSGSWRHACRPRRSPQRSRG
jgi:DNA polymerase-3 subunit delta'